MANGKTLKLIQKDIDDALDDTNSKSEVAILQALRYMIPFIEQANEDHVVISKRQEEIDEIKKYIEAEKKAREERKKERKQYIATAWGAAITTIIILAINGFIWFIKILPVLTKITSP